jgi:alpha-beta hydrolase superfamily lysophospholipase
MAYGSGGYHTYSKSSASCLSPPFLFFSGMCLNTSTMIPKHKQIKAVVCFCHGYGDNASYIKRIENQRLVDQGVAFCSIEYEGHGKSDGTLGLINDWDKLIDDVASYFQEIALKKFHGKPVFLMGESMGGAVAFSTYNRIPDVFRGVVFLCPMCKIGDDMLPAQWVIDFLVWMIGPTGTTSFLGFLPIAPAKGDMQNASHKLQEKSDMISRCPTVFSRNPRLATARELIGVTQNINNSLKDFEAPFVVLHGKEDRVTDPALSQALYDESKSKDKTIHLYEGMWHALTSGEPDENIDRVFNDCIEWILKRA